jgi:hypothetical protein
MKDYYTELRQIAEAMCQKYADDPQLEAAMVTGSVALGQVDAASDIDMMLYYREMPSAARLEQYHDEALASGGGIYAYEPGEGLVCYFFVDGVRVDFAFQKTADFAQMISEFAAEPDLSEKNKLIIMSGIQQCVPLYGSEIIAGWQQQLNNLPASFYEEIVRKYLRFPPIAVMKEMGVDRGDYGLVYELILEAAENTLNVLCGLNRVIPPGKVKGMGLRLEKMSLTPAHCAERFQQLWLLPLPKAVPHLYQLVYDLLDLIDNHMPQIGTRAARDRLLLSLRKN